MQITIFPSKSENEYDRDQHSNVNDFNSSNPITAHLPSLFCCSCAELFVSGFEGVLF